MLPRSDSFVSETHAFSLPPAYLYIRGAGGALFWSVKGDVAFHKREDLTQIDLDQSSMTRPAAQAVIPANKASPAESFPSKRFPKGNEDRKIGSTTLPIPSSRPHAPKNPAECSVIDEEA